MQDPERLLSVASEADPLEREVLTALRRAQAPAHAKAAAWGGVAAGIAAATLPATASGTAAAAGASSKAALGAGAKVALGAATKVALAATLATAALSGAYVYYERGSGGSAPVSRNAPRSSALRVTPPVVAAPASPIVTPEPVELAEPAPETPPPPSAPRANGKEKSGDSLAEESALLGAARSELRNGDALAADATLKRLRVRFPKGVLVQEREVLAIEVLAARGQVVAAKRQARVFVQRYPDSPHSAKLRLLSTEP